MFKLHNIFLPSLQITQVRNPEDEHRELYEEARVRVRQTKYGGISTGTSFMGIFATLLTMSKEDPSHMG